jgi:hypothetical protein
MCQADAQTHAPHSPVHIITRVFQCFTPPKNEGVTQKSQYFPQFSMVMSRKSWGEMKFGKPVLLVCMMVLFMHI